MKPASKTTHLKSAGLLRKMLIIFFCISFIPAFLVAIISFEYSRLDKLQSVLSEMLELNSLKQELITTYLEEQVFRAQIITESEAMKNLSEGIDELLRENSVPGALPASEVHAALKAQYEPSLIQSLGNNQFSSVLLVSNKNADILYSNVAGFAQVGSRLTTTGASRNIYTVWEHVKKTGTPVIYESAQNADGTVDLLIGMPVADENLQSNQIVIYFQALDNIQKLSQYEFNNLKTRESYILDKNNLIITSPEFPIGLKTLGESYTPEHVQKAIQQDQYSQVVQSIPEDKKIIFTLQNFHLETVSGMDILVDWKLATQMDYAEFTSPILQKLLITFLFTLAITLGALILGYSQAKKITKPILYLDNEVSRITEGYLDFKAISNRKDEIGTLERNTEAMIGQLRGIAILIDETIRTSNQIGLSLASSVEEQSAISVEQAGSIAEISSTMDEFTSSFGQVSENVSSVSEMVQKILDYVTESSQLISSVAAKMNDINKDNDRDISYIMELKKRSKEIAKVMEIINSISDQTKIIAFNAALEASSAGEAGKRFGVVAAEIRKLTENVIDSTASIDAIVTEIQTLADQMVLASEKTTKNIGEGLEYSSESVHNMEAIVSSITTSSDATKQIVLSVQQQKSATAQIQMGLKELSLGAQQNSETIQALNSMGDEFKEMGQKLSSLISHFKLDRSKDKG
jgi:methyl-accepting chemotaxis protein